jgi:hypothetical protein
MKQTTLCLGTGCYRIDDFEELDCAEPIETADSTNPLSLGVGLPGCDEPGPICPDGTYPDCETPPPEY